MQHFPKQHHFTLIELLVVVAIISILAAMMLPALSKARKHVKYTMCKANLKQVGAGLIMYADDHDEWYPPHAGLAGIWPARVLCKGGLDNRPMYKGYIEINNMFNDPMSTSVDFENSTVDTVACYSIWAGFAYRGQAGMTKVGRPLKWGADEFSLLVADHHAVSLTTGVRRFNDSHPDKHGVLQTVVMQNTINGTSTQWRNLPPYGAVRGPTDFNCAYEDGSVVGLQSVGWGDTDPRMVRVPHYSTALRFPAASTFIPRD